MENSLSTRLKNISISAQRTSKLHEKVLEPGMLSSMISAQKRLKLDMENAETKLKEQAQLIQDQKSSLEKLKKHLMRSLIALAMTSGMLLLTLSVIILA